MFKNIVFDLGNVLVRFDAKGHVEKYVQDEKVVELIFNEVFRSKEWIQYDRGILTLDEVTALVQARVPDEYHDIIKSVVGNWRTELVPHTHMEGFVEELKSEGYKIYLLSNVSKLFYSFRNKIPVLANFDGEFISGDYGLIKPEKEIYLEFYKKFDLMPEECFFIDDLGINIESAERTGMKGFVYHGDLDKLRAHMEKLGILR